MSAYKPSLSLWYLMEARQTDLLVAKVTAGYRLAKLVPNLSVEVNILIRCVDQSQVISMQEGLLPTLSWAKQRYVLFTASQLGTVLHRIAHTTVSDTLVFAMFGASLNKNHLSWLVESQAKKPSIWGWFPWYPFRNKILKRCTWLIDFWDRSSQQRPADSVLFVNRRLLGAVGGFKVKHRNPLGELFERLDRHNFSASIGPRVS